MILFDELGLADKSKSNPLKVLHSKLESYEDEENSKISFVGISNWTLDAAKVNRALTLSVPDLDENLDDLIKTSKAIAKSIHSNLENHIIFTNIIPNAYKKYKQILKDLKDLLVYSLYELNKLEEFKQNNEFKKEFQKLFCEKKKIKISEFQNKKYKLNEILEKEKIDIPWKEINHYPDEDDELKQLNKKYKNLNVEFHGNRDFYYLIKGIANELALLNNDYNIDSIKDIIDKYISRNFGGADIKLDVDLSLNFEDKRSTIDFISKYLIKDKKNEDSIIINSDLLFKKVYNFICYEDKDYSLKNYMIENKNVANRILTNIIDNINDSKSRYMLIQIKPSLGKLIYLSIEKHFKKGSPTFFEGSPFIDDNNSEYQNKMVNIIQEYSSNGGLLVFQNLNQIYPFLYDLFNMNYIIKDGKKYARINLSNSNDQLVNVNDNFRILIEEEEQYINSVDPPFLNRFEKLNVTFDKLLDESQKKLADLIYNDELNIKEFISQKKKDNYTINYQINDLIIGSEIQDIQALLCYYTNKKKLKIILIMKMKITILRIIY